MSSRGIDQFGLEHRSGLSGFMGQVGILVFPFTIMAIHCNFFGKRTRKYIGFLIFIILLSNMSDGGRRTIAYFFISLMLYGFYYMGMSKKKIIIYALIGVSLLGLSMLIRSNENTSLLLGLTSLLQVNSDSSFLWFVKEYKEAGISLTPISFSYHFLSIFVPSFIFILLTGRISYERSSFLFNDLFNTNPNQGYDFMTLADFYWCFGAFGYVLFVFVFYYVINYFRKHIYSLKPHKVVIAIMMIVWFSQQRNDFGAILKPVVYSYIFLYIINRFCIRKQ